MFNFTTFFTNLTWLLLPLMIFLIYEAYSENINNRKNNTILDFALLTSLYLMIRFGNLEYILEITFDTIIVLMYMKKRTVGAVIASLIGIVYFKEHLIMLILKYVIFFILCIIYKNDKRYYLISTFLTCIVYLIFLTSFNDTIYYLICYIVTYSINILFIKAENIIEINISYKELMKEQKLRKSLFKISHEIKNPIAVVKGYLDMFDTNNIDQINKYIPIIKSEISRTLNLLQDFSACSRISIETDIMDVGMLLEDIKEKFSLMFNKKNVEFVVILPEDEIFINGDYNRLSQVLVNMIKNSIEAIDKNKESYIKIGTEVINNKVKIIIEDNGVGISSLNMSRISEPFFTTKQNGTGLGVLLSKEIVAAHKGSIKYDSIEGIGTTVVITLPIEDC